MKILIFGSLQLGFVYAILALGVYIAYRILNLADLTMDGSFMLGMAVCAVVTAAGHPLLALLLGALAGSLAGLITGLLQTKIGIQSLLAGILTMTALYSVNLFIMGGRANISLYGTDTVFTLAQKLFGTTDSNITKLVAAAAIALLAAGLLAVFFKTRLGLSIRATGDNETMVRSSSINADMTKCIGFMLGNAATALSGAVLCQYQTYVDVGFGSGMVVIGLASVIIGETLFGRRGVTGGLMLSVLGSVVYRVIIAIALKFNILPSYGLKLVSAVIVAAALSVPALKNAVALKKTAKELKKK